MNGNGAVLYFCGGCANKVVDESLPKGAFRCPLVANIINPKIIGGSLSISPLLVIFSVTVGGAYFGVLGMFLAVPIFTVIKLLIEEYIEYKSSTI